MGEVIFVIGGCKSGKTSFALSLSDKYPELKKIYVATSVVCDHEMEQRVKRHREERKNKWETVECPYELIPTMSRVMTQSSLILVDCLTMWINNLFFKGMSIQQIENEMNGLIELISKPKGVVIFVSNEVGLGIVPVDEISRKYRDVIGILHQKVARIANRVYFVTCGIPNLIKSI